MNSLQEVKNFNGTPFFVEWLGHIGYTSIQRGQPVAGQLQPIETKIVRVSIEKQYGENGWTEFIEKVRNKIEVSAPANATTYIVVATSEESTPDFQSEFGCRVIARNYAVEYAKVLH